MDLSKFSLFSAIAGRLAWLSQRQQVLANNIANADTPGYAARDIAPVSFRDLVEAGNARLALRPAGGTSLAGAIPARHYRDGETATSFEVEPSGNSVVLEEQMMKVADNSMQYQLVTNLYRKHLGLIRTALGGGQG